MNKNSFFNNHIQVFGIGFGSKAEDNHEAKNVKKIIKKGMSNHDD